MNSIYFPVSRTLKGRMTKEVIIQKIITIVVCAYFRKLSHGIEIE